MASGAAGSLVVTLGLDAAQFTSGLTKAEYQARQFGEQLGAGLRTAGALAVAGLATVATAAVGAAAGFNSLVKAAGDFQDLAEKTGGSAEGLASLAVSAAVGGASMEAVAAAAVKLTKNLTGVDDESKAAGAAIGALGLNLKDFKALAPEAQLEAVGKALNGFQDGASKTAVAVALLGKAGADMLPFLKELGQEGGRQIILTAEQIKQADDYSDKQAKAKAQLGLYAQAIATQFLPAVTALTGAFTDMIKETVGVSDAASKLANQNAVQKFAEDAVENLSVLLNAVQIVARGFDILGTGIGATAATASALLDRDFKGAATIQVEAAKDMFNKVATIGDNLISDRLKKGLAAQKKLAAEAKFDESAGLNTGKPLAFNGPPKKSGGGAGDDPTKKILDNQLKALENAASEESDILRSRNKMLDLYNGENLISTQDYYAGKRAAQEAAVQSQTALYDQEIKALQDYQDKAGKATDREAAQGKINDLLEKKKKLSREAGETAIEWGFKEAQALENLAKQMNNVNAEVLELTGNLGEAARIRVGDQFGDLTKRLSANGDTAGLAQVQRLKDLKIAQADYGQQAEQVGQITASLQIQEDRIGLSRQLGADSELSSLIKLRDARGAAVNQMRSMVEAQEAIAKASGNPALVQNAERARLELDKLAATADPLADKFNSIFSDSFGDAFADFVTGTKTASEAFKSFTSSVISSFAKIAAEAAAKQIFGSLLGGASGGSADSIGGWLSGLFGKASGGMVAPGSMQRVNENGPELLDVNGKQYLMNGSRNARVTSNSKMGGGMTYAPTFYVSEPASRKTQDQIFQKARQGFVSAGSIS